MRVRADTSRTARTPASARTRDGHRRRGVAPWARAAVLAAVLAAAPAARAAGAGGDLLWPTDAGRCVTSSFCEFRSGHFHAGIDISTNGRTGYRVYAVDGGDVVRVRSGCKGYGKALYLRLRDGRTAVYAHLDAFAGAVEDTARAIGARTGSAYFDREFPPGTFPFARGDIVAYSGESGIGVPHLHFEIRDAQERPMDPLRAGLAVTDRTPPRVRRVAITPLDAGSSVDGGPEALRLDGPEADRVIPVEGRIGLAIDASDTKDGCRYDLAPAAVGMREDGRVTSEVRFDRFSFDETGHLDFQIDPRWSYTSRGRFQNLFRREGYDLPFVTVDEERGVLRGGDAGGEERRRIDLFARDSEGREGTRTVDLSFAPPPSLAGLALEDGGDSLVVRGRCAPGGRGVERVEVSRSDDGGATWTAAGEARPDGDGAFSLALAARAPDAGAVVVRARPVDRLGTGGLARAAAAGPAPASSPSLESPVRTHGPFWEVRLAEVMAVEVRPDTLAGAVLRSDGWGVRVLVPADAGAPDSVDVAELVDPWGRVTRWRVASPPVASPQRGVRVGAARAEVSFLPATVREATAVRVREAGRPAHAPAELASLGDLVAVDTGAVPLASDFEIRLEAAHAPRSAGRVAVFVQDGRGFRYIGGREDPDGRGWVVRARTASPLGLFEDRAAPRLGVPRLSAAGGRTRLVFGVTDGGAGVDCDGIEVLADGRPVPHELDAERGEVVGWPVAPPAAGAALAVEIRAVDRCGNVATWKGALKLP